METLVPNWIKNDKIIEKDVKYYFSKRKIPYTEESMIEILKTKTNSEALVFSLVALREIGTIKAIEAIKNIVHFKKLDVQATSVLTIAVLTNGSENEYLGKLLLEKEFKEKWYAMLAILYNADKKALPYVLEYGKRTIKNCKNMADAGGLILTYLARFSPENEDCKKIFAKINKDFSNLYPHGQKCLKDEFPNIFGINN